MKVFKKKDILFYIFDYFSLQYFFNIKQIYFIFSFDNFIIKSILLLSNIIDQCSYTLQGAHETWPYARFANNKFYFVWKKK